MGFAYNIVALLMLLVGGGVRDLASCISTETYWKAKGTTPSLVQLTHELEPVKAVDVSKLIADFDADDPKVRDAASERIFNVGPGALPALEATARDGSPEAAARSTKLIARFLSGAKPAAVRRLMAIRSLGEMKDRAALAALQPLLESKVMFEAEYARAAIARIEAKPYATPPATDAERAVDVALLPERINLVGQLAPSNGDGITIESVIAQFPTRAAEKARMLAESTKFVVELLEQVGNIRLDAITWGTDNSLLTAGQQANVTIVARGLFDANAVGAALGKVAKESRTQGGAAVFRVGDEGAVLLSSNRRIAYVLHSGNNDAAIAALAASLKRGAGEFSNNVEMAALLKTVDRTAPFWAAFRLGNLKDFMARAGNPVGDFDTVTLVVRQSRDKETLVTDMKMELASADKAQAAQTAAKVSSMLQLAVTSGREEVKRMPALKPLIDFVAGIKVQADGSKVVLSATMRDLPISSIFMGMGAVDVEEQAVPATKPAP